MRDIAAAGTGLSILDETDFADPRMRRIFEAIAAVFERGESPDIHVVGHELEKRGHIDAIGGLSFLVEVIDTVFTAANVQAHARIVKEKAVLRALTSLGASVSERASKNAGNVTDLLNETSEQIVKLASFGQSNFSTAREVGDRVQKRYIDYMNHTASVFYPTPWKDLNRLISGIKLAEYTVIAARPGCGKSALAHQFSTWIAGRHKVPIGIFTLEMSTEEVLERMCFQLASVDSIELRHGRLSAEQLQKLQHVTSLVSSYPFIFDESADLDPIRIRSRVRQLSQRHGCKIVILDHLQLVSGPRKSENRQQEMTAISRACAISARETGVGMVVLSQMNRQSESRGSGRPTLADLRESGAIEQDAHNVVFLWHPAKYGDRQAPPGMVEAIVAKQRNGPTGDCHLTWLPTWTRFENYAGELPDEEPGY